MEKLTDEEILALNVSLKEQEELAKGFELKSMQARTSTAAELLEVAKQFHERQAKTLDGLLKRGL